ncbi:MAG: helix-turn-helix domain-containing protein [Bacteroidota bacterium]
MKVTAAGREVLFEGRQVQLVQRSAMEEAREQRAKQVKPKTKRQRVRDELFEVLRGLRKELAMQKGIPPYVVFSDASLEEMAARRPVTEAEFREVGGVGERKLELYGQVFMATIRDFIKAKSQEGLTVTGATVMDTMTLYQQGMTVPEIADNRGISERTIYTHIAKLIQMNEPVAVEDFVSKWEITCVKEALEVVEKPVKLKPIFEFLDEKVPYHKIQIALAHLWRRKK